ncbi:hypothetical protein TCAL_13779, partial [Tigriopus californicus]
DESPVFVNIPGNISINLSQGDQIPAPANVIATDNCDTEPQIEYTESRENDSDCKYVIVRTWEALDKCGNTTRGTQRIQVVDEVDVEIKINGDLDCAVSGVEVSVENIIPGATYTWTASDNGTYDLRRVWTATDESGNTASTEVVIHVVDTQAPTFESTPQDLFIGCNDQLPTDEPIIVDECSGDNIHIDYHQTECDAQAAQPLYYITNGEIEYLAQSQNPVHPTQTVRALKLVGVCNDHPNTSRRWKITNPNNFEVSVISIKENSYIRAENYTIPANQSVYFLTTKFQRTNANDFGISYLDQNNNTVFINAPFSVESDESCDLLAGERCVCVYKRTWEASDECGNKSTKTQYIYQKDDRAPNFTNVPADGCGGHTLIRKWTATDECNNGTFVKQVLRFNETGGAHFSIASSQLNLSCEDAIPPAPNVTATGNNNQALTVNFHEDNTGDNCNRTITRTWSTTSGCGSEESVVQTITIADTEAPVIVFTNPILNGIANGGILTMPCDDLQGLDESTASITDNCDPNPTVTFEDVSLGGNCQTDGYIERFRCTWVTSDRCGNTRQFQIFVEVRDDVAPTFNNVPAAVSISCEESIPTDLPSATDNCTEVSITETQRTVPGPCANSYVLVREFTATDECGNSATTSQEVTVEDHTAPTFSNVPQNISLDCGETAPTDQPVVNDNCDDAVTLTENSNRVDHPNACNNAYTLTRIWTATDNCGNTATVSQVVTIGDTQAPQISFNNPLLNGGSNGQEFEFSCDQAAQIGETDVNVTDNCDSDIDLTFDEQVLANGNCSTDGFQRKVQYTWTATDDCGNAETLSIIVKYVDTNSPEMWDVPPYVTIACNENLPTDQPKVRDDCTATDQISVEETTIREDIDCANHYRIIRLWTATDNCGNTRTGSQIVTFYDNQGATFTGIPANVSISCDDDLPTDLPVANDACTGDLTVSVENFRTNGSCGGNYIITRVFSATDACGNKETASQVITVRDTESPVFTDVPQNITVDATDACGNKETASQVITVRDTESPVFTDVPQNITVECSQGTPTTMPTATDNCDQEVSITENAQRRDGACPDSYELIRIWTATDDCGNTATASQTVSFEDRTAPVFGNIPTSINLSCDASMPQDLPIATDDCDSEVTVTVSENRTDGSCVDSYSVVRVFTATDNCGNTATASQTVTVGDDSPPSFSSVPAATTINCQEIIPTEMPVATDNCSNQVLVEESTEERSGNCANSYEIIRVFTATDDCGNTATASQIITVQDIEAPTFTFVPPYVTIVCDSDIPTDLATATDNCDTDVTIEEEQSTRPLTCPGHYELVRLFTASDNCGNTSTASQIVTFFDNVAPVFSNVPTDVTLACNEQAPTDEPTATDNCDTNVNITYAEEREPGSCPGSYDIIRIWTATDHCGYASTASQRVSFQDTSSPEFSQIPSTVTISCDDALPTNSPIASDNCDTDVSVEEAQNTIPGSCTNNYQVIRTWTATDNCGNTATASQTVIVEDVTAPRFTQVPTSVSISCNDNIPSDPAIATDNCDQEVTITEAQTTNPGPCGESYSITRIWTATDNCGNTTTASQEITVTDQDAPEFSFVPESIEIACDQALPTDQPEVTDNCDQNVDLSETQETIAGNCPDSYTIIRTWVATDNCGNTSTASQSIAVQDLEAPVFANIPEEVTIACDASLPTNQPAVTDNCDIDIDITENQETQAGNCPGNYLVVRTWLATDNCGNTSTASQIVNVEDVEAPSFTYVPETVTISCADQLPTNLAVATDNCDTDVNITETQERSDGNCAATDHCGNISTASQEVKFEDVEAPVFADVPVEVTIACEESLPSASPTATDNCDTDVNITETQETQELTCENNYRIIRIWTATDHCGNTATVSQAITVEDRERPVFANVPPAATISCEESMPSSQPTATDNCDQNVDISESEEILPGNCGGSYRIVKQWTATDNCGNTATATQLISVQDINAPEFSSVPANADLSCSDQLPTDMPTATDNCDDDVHISEDQQRVPGNCDDGYIIVRTFTATDECGNTATASQVLNISDTEAPVLIGVPENQEVSCAENMPTEAPTATDNCDQNVTITLSEDRVPGTCENKYQLVKTWTATDNCGNTATASQVLQVEDNEAPSFASVPENIEVSCSGEIPTSSPTATDNCDQDVSISETQEQNAGSCENSYEIIRTWIATDNCGNTASTRQVVTVKDDEAPTFANVPANTSVGCDQELPSTAPTATDNCDQEVSITETTDRTTGNCTSSEVVTRIWTATDNCGNTATTSQQVTIGDDQAPTFTNIPENVNLLCDQDLPTDLPTATDNCDQEVSITESQEQVDGSCNHNYRVIRIWTAEDNCGNTATASQTVSFSDDSSPVFANVPESIEINCSEALPTDMPTMTDNCDTEICQRQLIIVMMMYIFLKTSNVFQEIVTTDILLLEHLQLPMNVEIPQQLAKS